DGLLRLVETFRGQLLVWVIVLVVHVDVQFKVLTRRLGHFIKVEDVAIGSCAYAREAFEADGLPLLIPQAAKVILFGLRATKLLLGTDLDRFVTVVTVLGIVGGHLRIDPVRYFLVIARGCPWQYRDETENAHDPQKTIHEKAPGCQVAWSFW